MLFILLSKTFGRHCGIAWIGLCPLNELRVIKRFSPDECGECIHLSHLKAPYPRQVVLSVPLKTSLLRLPGAMCSGYTEVSRLSAMPEPRRAVVFLRDFMHVY